MLVQIIHIFYYHGIFYVLDVEFMKSLKYLNFCFWIYFILRLQMALQIFKDQLRVKFDLGSLWNTPPPLL